MVKILHIAWKDLVLFFRDTGALAFLLLTPFALTLAIAFAFGRPDNKDVSVSLADIPVAIVNHDQRELGQALVEVFESDDLAELLEPVHMQDEAAAQAMVDADQAAAAIVVSADLTDSVMPTGLALGDLGAGRAPAVVKVYANPGRPISVGVVRGIVDQFLNRTAAGAAGAEVAITQLIASRLVPAERIMPVAEEVGRRAAERASSTELITILSEARGKSQAQGFDWLAYMAPSMAILALMFTVTSGGRSILAEREEGTLPRILTTPTSAAQVLGGKVLGIMFTGLAQMGILIVATSLLLGVEWGAPLALVVTTVALVTGATGWGLLIAAFARTAGQANAVGGVLSLVFAVAAGNLMPRSLLPEWLQMASYITPNAWGVEIYGDLAAGATLVEMAVPVLALLAMAALLFALSIAGFRRQFG